MLADELWEGRRALRVGLDGELCTEVGWRMDRLTEGVEGGTRDGWELELSDDDGAEGDTVRAAEVVAVLSWPPPVFTLTVMWVSVDLPSPVRLRLTRQSSNSGLLGGV